MVRDRQHGPVVELNRIQVTGVPGALRRGAFGLRALSPQRGEEHVPPGGAPGGELTAFFRRKLASLTQKHKEK